MSPKTKQQFQSEREQSRNRIMQAALELFGTKGYSVTSISDIAREAGISKGLMYHYFSGKEDLLRQMMEDFSQRGDKMSAAWQPDDPSQTLKNLISMVFRELRENYRFWRLTMNLSVQVDQFEFVHQMALEKMKDYLGLFEKLLGEMNWDHPAREARLLAAVFDGIGLQYFILKDDFDLDGIEKALIEKYCS